MILVDNEERKTLTAVCSKINRLYQKDIFHDFLVFFLKNNIQFMCKYFTYNNKVYNINCRLVL